MTDNRNDAGHDDLRTWERLRLSWALLRDDRVGWWAKSAVPVVAMLYVLLPVDVIPDVLIGIGQLDDVSVIGLSLFAMTKVLPKLAPDVIVREHLNRLRGTKPPESTGEPDGAVIETTFTVIDSRQGETGKHQFERAWGNRA